jgi:L-lactate dehydrogenase complex protein LldG
MQESTSREKVLKAIRDALVHPMATMYESEDYADKIYKNPPTDYHEVNFAEALARVGGQFVYNSTIEEFAANFKTFLKAEDSQDVHCYDEKLQKLLNQSGIFCFNVKDDFEECHVGVTGCEFLLARTGSIMVSSRQDSGRRGYIWPPVHIVIAWNDQFVHDLKQAFAALKIKYQPQGIPSMVTLITGPSRTADIEKTLVMGAHGPAKLVVFFIDMPSDTLSVDDVEGDAQM